MYYNIVERQYIKSEVRDMKISEMINYLNRKGYSNIELRYYDQPSKYVHGTEQLYILLKGYYIQNHYRYNDGLYVLCLEHK